MQSVADRRLYVVRLRTARPSSVVPSHLCQDLPGDCDDLHGLHWNSSRNTIDDPKPGTPHFRGHQIREDSQTESYDQHDNNHGNGNCNAFRAIRAFLANKIKTWGVGLAADRAIWEQKRREARGSTTGEGGNMTISSPGRSPKQPLPGMRLHDSLHGRQACPIFIAFDQGVGQICPGRGYFRAVLSPNGDKYVTSPLPPPNRLTCQVTKGSCPDGCHNQFKRINPATT